MDILNNFLSKDLTDQMSILNEIECQSRKDAIPGLLNLYENPGVDTVIDYMIEQTLMAVLVNCDKEVISGLKSSNTRTNRLAVQIAGQNRLASAVKTIEEMAADETKSEILMDVISALASIKAPGSLSVFRRHINNQQELVSALCIEMVALYNDMESVDRLCGIVAEADLDPRPELCNLRVAKAIESLGVLKNEKAVVFLASKIHHKDPTARRLIQKTLVDIGPKIVQYLETIFIQDNIDNKIMVANVLGMLGDKKGGDILVTALDKGEASHPNVRFAIYEALGHIPFMKGIVCLMDGLMDKNDMVLMAVISSLDINVNLGVIDRIRKIINAGGEQGERLTKAIVASRALAIFNLLYNEEHMAALLVSAVSESGDSEVISAFRERLESISNRARIDAERLLNLPPVISARRRILAVDDSKAMVLFYRSVGAGSNLDVTTASNGKEALDILNKREVFDIIVTDMNMPEMDGIEFTKKTRLIPSLMATPIIMVTTESEKSQIDLAKQVGVNAFVIKPFTPEIFIDRIKEYF
ncbi:MAG: response regulator [Pseudomonadota bacterium]